MKMLLWVCNPVSRRLENGNVSIYMVDMEDMVALSEDFEMTQESMELSQGQGIWKLKGKEPNKEKMQRAILESLHLSTMTTSYNTHFACTLIQYGKIGHIVDSNDYLEVNL